ncbi:MarR family winged helix-turn-helix transcriptional regulator [Microbacterium sp. ZW T2_14]|uniref:MarR family winged helix-turn-helix transcriptional regulator n=1 Tax=Microbacterium sp. ZW T2_14 TaxID=3378079 RepID=UPI003853FA80
MTGPRDVSPLLVGLQLHRAYAVATERLNAALQPLGLGYRHVTAMFLIRDGIATHGELVRRLHVDKTGMVRTIDDLERLGLVSKTRSTEDRRSWLLALTSHGSATLIQAQQHTRAVADDLFGGLEPAQLALLSDALAAVAPDDASDVEPR